MALGIDEKECRWRSVYPGSLLRDGVWPLGLKLARHSTSFGPRSLLNRRLALEEELSWIWSKHTFASGEARPPEASLDDISLADFHGTLDDREEVPCPRRDTKRR